MRSIFWTIFRVRWRWGGDKGHGRGKEQRAKNILVMGSAHHVHNFATAESCSVAGTIFEICLNLGFNCFRHGSAKLLWILLTRSRSSFHKLNMAVSASTSPPHRIDDRGAITHQNCRLIHQQCAKGISGGHAELAHVQLHCHNIRSAP